MISSYRIRQPIAVRLSFGFFAVCLSVSACRRVAGASRRCRLLPVELRQTSLPGSYGARYTDLSGQLQCCAAMCERNVQQRFETADAQSAEVQRASGPAPTNGVIGPMMQSMNRKADRRAVRGPAATAGCGRRRLRPARLSSRVRCASARPVPVPSPPVVHPPSGSRGSAAGGRLPVRSASRSTATGRALPRS